MLEGVGVQVEDAASGEQALAAAREAEAQGAPFDLALIDWKMPVVDGLQTAERLRQCGLSQLPQMILISAALDLPTGLLQQGGFAAHLVKPFTRSALLAALGSLRPPSPPGPGEASVPPAADRNAEARLRERLEIGRAHV